MRPRHSLPRKIADTSRDPLVDRSEAQRHARVQPRYLGTAKHFGRSTEVPTIDHIQQFVAISLPHNRPDFFHNQLGRTF